MIIETRHPEKSLQSVLKEYYFIHIQSNSVIKHIPIIDDCCYDFVFFKEMDGSFSYSSKNDFIPLSNKVFTIHNLKPPYKITIQHTLTFIAIKVQPWANAYFFSAVKASGVVDLVNYDASLLDLHDKLFNEQPLANRYSTVDQYMKNKCISLTPSMEVVKAVCMHIYDQQGILTVSDLSTVFNKSRQYLNKVFKKEVMYSLKKFIITVRILALVKYKMKNASISLTQLSYTYGYFDQSHFIRDFKKVCGVTPRHFFNNVPEFMLRH
ncbi:helix-turn-helix domain-containing protein [Pontibacter arcticus]|uniref:HTH araC/xylS-type domain-containing protein n=1 Tax=Pontibacter arcticus TaxID=2080288 RepID=A0A364RF17_9BACT|nr:helix-turn-helix transcriptional regulator [Pontibacter arcticus]RAU82857.1 hypothetical protein DP923_06280 [Pontibacter arcticus]